MKKRTLSLLLTSVLISTLLVACGKEQAIAEPVGEIVEETTEAVEEVTEEIEEVTVEEADADEAEETVESETEAADEAAAESKDAEVAVKEVTGKDVVIDGKNYVEYDFIEDETTIGYNLENNSVTVLSDSELAGTGLALVDDGKSLSFDVAVSGNGKIEGKTVTIDIVNLVGQIGDSDPADFSDLFRKGDGCTVSFGKGYYDGDSSLYVEVFITVPKKMFTTTAVIDL